MTPPPAPWSESGIAYSVSVGLESQGFAVRAVNVSELGPGRARVRVLLPWWSWPIAIFTGSRAALRAEAAALAEVAKPIAVALEVSAGWLR
jgi:hypothetical protein